MWKIFLAIFFFVAAILMLGIGLVLPSRSPGRVSAQDQAMIYATLFLLAGFVFLTLVAHT